MNKPVPPCFKCTIRTIGCHDHCDLYHKYQADHAKWVDLIKTAKQLDSTMSEIELSRFQPYYKHKLRKDKNRSGF